MKHILEKVTARMHLENTKRHQSLFLRKEREGKSRMRTAVKKGSAVISEITRKPQKRLFGLAEINLALRTANKVLQLTNAASQ